ncbi:26S proteasome non-ATPase regulatory subunit 1-like [Hippocampus zosterae]|uniref:26S proteasome non-ATPase regulatory subunit 1-like n=1 Tax=Hippocampus zosterae TaxID=109293 RepID=UPI00223C8FBB|nr:26S proteasome non-ATPase regulatory subunit 1-like [Hippocampus zosterae]
MNNCQTDPHYLAKLKSIEHKNSLAHSSAVLSISMLQAYTQDDSFIKDQENLEWVSHTNLWGKFNCTASLGLIHQGTKLPPLEVFKKYLHEQNPDGKEPFLVGGAMFGLGLLTAGKKVEEVINYCLWVIDNPTMNTKEPIVHGACLCLGLAGFASADLIIYEKLKNILDTDTAVTSQAAALAIGLVMASTNSEEVLADLLGFESGHDKINNAICQAIALVTLGKPSSTLVSGLSNSQTIKRAIPLHLAAAHFGTSNSKAVKQLLALSSDISNEIKRTAVICLGFVLHNNPELLGLMKMMSSSYNPHIRYGLCLALAVGGPLEQGEAIADLIWPFFTDTTEFVRQAAFLAIAMLALNGALSATRVADFRKLIDTVLAKKHEDVLVRMGVILSVGILDAGGRNMKISLRSSTGNNDFALAAMLVFTDFWHWYPLINFLGLALSPTVLIGIDSDFRIPLSFNWKCQAKPSTFSYPAMIQKAERKEEKKSTLVELSTARRVQSKAFQKKDSLMEIEPPKEKDEKEKDEPSTYLMKNASRVLDKQTRFITWVDNRFIPLIRDKRQGIIFLKDTQPGVEEQYLGLPADPPKPAPAPPAEGTQMPE